VDYLDDIGVPIIN